MRRYHTEVLVRPADPNEDCCQGEHPLKADVTATNETDARHTICERAYSNQLLVSRFITIQVRGAV